MKLHEPNAPATSRQLWYLHILTKEDTRNLQITKVEANNRIRAILKNEIVIQPKPEPSKPKPKVKANLKRKSNIKVKAKSSGFDCWYCHNGHGHEDLLANTQPYTLCGCGASTVPLPRFKVSHNRKGGVRAVVFSKPFVSSVTSADRYAMAESARQFAEVK
jgi:hypothetical protein